MRNYQLDYSLQVGKTLRVKIMNVLVTGGAGYIGSVVVEELLENNHRVIVVDNLSTGHRDAVDMRARLIEGDIKDQQLVENILTENNIEAVIHMAGSSQVAESVQFPEKYYDNNVVAGKVLLDAMRAMKVKKIVFSSTAAVYGEAERQPIIETDKLEPTNPYGKTKLQFENELRRNHEEHGLSYVSLRYFNAAGASENCGERHDPETHLIPMVLQAALGRIPHINVFGDDYPTRDGTCVRDYIHVIDLARAHVLALNSLDGNTATYNLGCGGTGYTVREVIDIAREVTGNAIPESIASRRPGDPAVLIASSEKISRELGWKPEFQDLRAIINSAWIWLSMR